MTQNPSLAMALNNAWANATLHAAVRRMPATAFTAPRPGFFPTLAATLNHIYAVDLYYLDALEEGGKGRAVFDRDDVTDPAALNTLQSEADNRFIALCRGITPDRLAARVATDRPGGPVFERVDALILHLVQHQIHHRGQAHVQLSDAGVAPPQLDEFHLDYDRAPSAADYV